MLNKLSNLRNWKQSSSRNVFFCLGADVGGSGIRVRLSNYFDENQIIDLGHFKAKSAQNIYDIIDNIDHLIGKINPNAECKGSAYAIAGLRKGNSVSLLNWNGPNENRTIHFEKINHRLNPTNHSLLLNDLEAGAYGVNYMAKNNKTDGYYRKLFGKRDSIIGEKNIAVMGLGSGLGAAVINFDKITKNPLVISSEMGYMLISSFPKQNEMFDKDKKIIDFASKHYYNGMESPGYEDIASGRGLTVIYQYVSGRTGIKAEEISEMAKKGEKDAFEAMKLHYIYYTRCAKQLSMGMKCDTVLMSLSNQVKNDWLIKMIADDMRKEFSNYTRPEWINDVSVFTQIKDCNFNLVGTSYMAHYAAKNKIF